MGREWARTRPSSTLVVIDHADRQQVERLVCLLEDLTGRAHGLVALHMQAALREFADTKPPKPAEPTGLGAVVEEADALRWIRCRANEGTAPWRSWPAGMWREYADIDAVRVLSEGVTP